MTIDQVLKYAIDWTDRPLDELARDWPMFSEVELIEIKTFIPRWRQALMAGR